MDAPTVGLPGQTAAPVAPAAPGLAAINALFEDPASLRGLLRFCLWHLGATATPLDAEDALYEFYASRGQRVVDTFRPGSRTLTAYFKYCLMRFCWSEGEKLRKCINSADPVQEDFEYAEDGSVAGVPLPEPHEDWNPELKLLAEERNRKREAELARLREAIRQLPSDGQRLLRLYYEEKLSIPDIAARHLHISESAVKVRLHRLRRRIALSLKVDHDAK